MLVLDPEGRIVRANPAAFALAGTEPADIVGRGPGDVLRCASGSDDPRGCGFSAECPLCPLRAGLESVVGGGSLRGVEVPLMLQRQDGVRQAWIRVGAEPLALIDGQHHVILTLDDVTERRWAKEALRQSENELRTLIEAAPVAIIRLDRRARVELWNRAAEQIYGWTEAEVLGKALPILTTDDGAFDNGMFRRLHRGEPVSSVEIRNVRRDGTMIRAVLSAAPIFDASGEVIGSMGILRDVTEERETEERLRQSQKMEAVGQLAGGVAHDFNNLLTVIGGCCELLAMDSGLGDSSALELAEIRAAVDRASRLTHQILAFSRRQPLQPRVCSVNTLVEGVAPLLRRTLGEDVHLVVGLDERVSPTEVDPHQFEQVLLNLAVNSRVAMPNGGMLTIMTDDVELSDDYRATHPWIPPGRYVRVAVSDTGVGMDTETMSHAFEPFFTTKAPGAGTGLGLSTVYGIVQQSGGHVTLESEPGVGTTATVFLPIVTSVPSVVPEEPEATPQDDVLGHETIVVVEDEEPLRTLVARILRKSGYTVHTAPDAERGLALLGDPDLHVDLLLTDVVLTGSVQGGELGRRAQELRPGMTVLYMSGYPRGIGDRVPEGVNFLSKPFTPEVLAREVRAVLEGAAEMSGGGP
jgi:PAS domain S-box-containing protein